MAASLPCSYNYVRRGNPSNTSLCLKAACPLTPSGKFSRTQGCSTPPLVFGISLFCIAKLYWIDDFVCMDTGRGIFPLILEREKILVDGGFNLRCKNLHQRLHQPLIFDAWFVKMRFEPLYIFIVILSFIRRSGFFFLLSFPTIVSWIW